MIETTATLSSAAIPTDRGNFLRVSVVNFAIDPLRLMLRYSLLDLKSGTINHTSEALVAIPNETTDFQFPLSDAVLIRVTLTTTEQGQPLGVCYASFKLQQAKIADAANQQPIASGWVAKTQPLQYPEQTQNAAWGNDTAPLDISSYLVNNTTQLNINPPTNSFAKLHTLRFTFTASAVAANRRIRFAFSDASGVMDDAIGETVITATQARDCHAWDTQVPIPDTTTDHFIRFRPDKYYRALNLVVTADNVDVGDVFSNVTGAIQLRPLNI